MYTIILGKSYRDTHSGISVSLKSISLTKNDAFVRIDCSCSKKGNMLQCKTGQTITRCDWNVLIEEINGNCIIIEITKKKEEGKEKDYQAKWRSKYGLS